MKTNLCLALLLSDALACGQLRADPTVYNQPAADPNVEGYYTWASCDTPSNGLVPTYDNFSLGTTTSITAVQWTGNYIDTSNVADNPATPDTPTFQVNFYADNGGFPGQLLSSATLTLAECNPTLLSTVGFSDSPTTPNYQIPIYAYSATLPTAFTAAAGQPYWISVVGVCTADQPFWSWYSGDNGDGRCIQVFQGNQVRPSDCAFTLQGTPTTGPTPPSTFFAGQAALGNGVYYLAFANGNYFGYYSFLSDSRYIYHFDLGYEYVFDAGDGKSGVYLYDFASNDFFYTSPAFPFPYLYDFGSNAVLYYYPDPKNAGHYNTNGVRYFYDFATGQIITK